MILSNFSEIIVSMVYAIIFIFLSSKMELYLYFISLGVIISPVVISIKKLVLILSNIPLTFILNPPYSSSNLISLTLTISKLTLLSICIYKIYSKIFLIDSIFNGKLFKVASISFVVLKSSPMTEESKTPPFIISIFTFF